MNATSEFLTPPRILIPKLVRSRDNWKAKASKRKTQCKALQIRVRDLEASRDSQRSRADQLAKQVLNLQARIDQLHAAAACPAETAPKNSTLPKAANTQSV